MKNRNKLTRPICIIAILTVLLPIIFVFTSGAEGKYDYSRPMSTSNVTVTSDELLEAYLSTPISEAERDYLKEWGKVTLTYSSTVTSDRVVCEYSLGDLTVKAYTYTYTANDGTNLTWVPAAVTVGSERKSVTFDGECYTAEFSSIEEDESLTADVEYALKISIDRDDINAIATQAYIDAPRLEEEVKSLTAEYERLYAEYLTDKAEYEEYLAARAQFELDTASYREYLSRKKLYDDALSEYNVYLAELEAYNDAIIKQEEYNKALESYNKEYEEYLEYLSALADYNAKLKIYNAYVSNLEIAESHINIINTANVKMTLDRDVYSAIMGNLVTEVLVGNKDVLTTPAVGAKKEVIDAAGEATEVLRKLLPQYFSLKTDEERYSYYTLNFDAFQKNFTQLTQALDELYRNRRIRAEIMTQGRDQKYIILVCQLAIISNALNGGPISSYYGEYKFDSSYKIEKKTILQVLENKTYIPKDIDPTPLPNGYPREVEEPIAPEIKEEPVAPTPVKIPVKPEEVANPGPAPEKVEEPTKPLEVVEPTAPAPYNHDPRITALITAYKNGEITLRAEAYSSFEYVAKTVFRKKLFGVTEVTVVFHDTDGAVVQMSSLDKDTPVIYTGPIPVKAEDASATYTFSGWKDRDGNVYDLSSIPEDLMLYPHFAANTKYYNVTFDIDGEKTIVSYPYGAIPSYDKIPSRADDGGIMYLFKSWDRELSAVLCNTAYLAQFESAYILPLKVGGAEITQDDGHYIADCILSDESVFDIKNLLERALLNQKGIVLKTRYADLTIPYATVISMHGAGDSTVSLSVIQKGAYGYSYSVSITDGTSGVDKGYKISASFPCKLEDTANNSLFYLNNNGERSYVNYTLVGGRLDFKLTSGIEYSLFAEYTVNVIPSQFAEITVSTLVGRNGDAVEINVAMANGYRLVRLRVFDKDGNEIKLVGGAFTMPSCDVTVAAECEAITYTVTFMDGDKVLAVYTHAYGDTVIPPIDPVKLGDVRHKYTFVGWSEELAPVTEDVTYYAVYKTTLLPLPKEPEGLQISPSVMKLIVAFFVAVIMFVAVVIPSTVLLTVTLLRERKKFIKNVKGR